MTRMRPSQMPQNSVPRRPKMHHCPTANASPCTIRDSQSQVPASMPEEALLLPQLRTSSDRSRWRSCCVSENAFLSLPMVQHHQQQQQQQGYMTCSRNSSHLTTNHAHRPSLPSQLLLLRPTPPHPRRLPPRNRSLNPRLQKRHQSLLRHRSLAQDRPSRDPNRPNRHLPHDRHLQRQRPPPPTRLPSHHGRSPDTAFLHKLHERRGEAASGTLSARVSQTFVREDQWREGKVPSEV
ncbi:hypothetical protein BDZ85DRAFT_254429 [Elsinoe ampelina]|uniref:Uncharacterized protein n=1 Tax=Elsinoe ampelina TaxID=302913 RepID=A0A6A6GP44_9PEZI|nr:hypothetical protein BDZ85DRAFT_254429 [Elsinoe ampelina]